MIAIIDIGSNSVRLMLWADGKTLYKKVQTTRLGAGIASGMLSEEGMERTLAAVTRFCREGEEAGARVYAFATAAVRSAKNGREFCGRILHDCGLEVEIVSGGEEALLGLYGALGEGDGGIIDIGGASTEICFRKGGTVGFSVSLPVGAVRLRDACGEDRENLLSAIGEVLSPLLPPPAPERMYVIGGTGSTLASVLLGLERYDAQRIQDFPMSLPQLSALADRLLSLTAEERREIAGMDKKRVDIIAGGALLLVGIMKKLSLGEVCASDRDNLEGYLYLRGLA